MTVSAPGKRLHQPERADLAIALLEGIPVMGEFHARVARREARQRERVARLEEEFCIGGGRGLEGSRGIEPDRRVIGDEFEQRCGRAVEDQRAHRGRDGLNMLAAQSAQSRSDLVLVWHAAPLSSPGRTGLCNTVTEPPWVVCHEIL